MPNRAERGILARRPEREFIQIGLANEHGTRLAQCRDNGRVCARDVPLAHARSRRGRNAGDVDDVLDRNRDPVQRPAVAARGEFPIGRFRIAARLGGHHVDEGVQRRLEFVDAP